MIRWVIGLLLLAISLPALAHSPHSYDRSGHQIQVETTSPSNQQLQITVDGARWTYTASGSSSSISGPPTASAAEVMLVSSVVDQYLVDHPPSREQRASWPMLLLGLLLIGVGIASLLSPERVWYLTTGWRFRNAEPSGLALKLTRVGGLIGLVVGIVLILSGL